MTASTASNTSSASGARRLIGRRAIVALAIGASATLGLSACGAGQIAQTSSQVAGVTGSSGWSANGVISVIDTQLVYPSQENAREQNKLYVSFTAVNTDPVNADTLVGIKVNGQPMTLGDGDFTVTPNGAIATPQVPAYAAGEGATSSEPAATLTPAETGTQTAETTTTAPTSSATTTPKVPGSAEHLPTVVNVDPIDNSKVGSVGESVTVVFTFAEAGEVTMQVPLAVWHDVPRSPDSSLNEH